MESGYNGYLEKKEMQKASKTPFYQSTWFVILMMFCCCFPIGLFLMWKYKKFNQPVRIVLTALFVIAFVVGISNPSSDSAENVSSASVSSENDTAEASTMAETAIASAEESTAAETVTASTAESTVAETVTASTEESTAPVSEEEFKASCQEIGYKTLLRNPDDYIGQRIVFTAKIQQIMQGGLFDDNQYYRVQTDNDGYEYYLDDEYYMYDCRPEGSTKLLEGDVIRIYAEFAGTETVTRALTGTKEEIPAINAYYVDLISE